MFPPTLQPLNRPSDRPSTTARIHADIDALRSHLDEVCALPRCRRAVRIDNDVWRFVQGNRGRAAASRTPLPCGSRCTEDGRPGACCVDHDQRFSMGAVTRLSFLEAWNSPALQSLRAAHLRRDVRATIRAQCVACA